MAKDLKFAVRIDDPPGGTEIQCKEEIGNMAKVARKFNCPLTLAITTGILHDLPELQPLYKELYDEGLLKIACHGWYHEDFTGLDRGETSYPWPRKPLFIRGVKGKEADGVLKRCQDFTQRLFGQRYTLFINPGRAYMPFFPNEFYNLLIKHKFRAISAYFGAIDPLFNVFIRPNGLAEIPFSIYVDFYQRQGAPGVKYSPEKFDQYMEATKDHIRMRFRYGLYVCLMTHAIGFHMKPEAQHEFSGNDPGGRFLDKLLSWVRSEYPDARFVGMEALIPKNP